MMIFEACGLQVRGRMLGSYSFSPKVLRIKEQPRGIKLLSIFSLVISNRKWQRFLCSALQRNHHDQLMGRFRFPISVPYIALVEL
jgi:hypothetical protein